MKKKSGTPTAYRAIIRDLKSGRDGNEIEKRLKKLPDPYYISLGLMELADLSGKQDIRAAEGSLSFAARVDRDWRRAELLGMLCKKMKGWPEGKDRDAIGRQISSLMEEIPQGETLSEAIKGCARFLCTSGLSRLFTMAADNSSKDAKYVVKTALDEGAKSEELAELIRGRESREQRAELLGYLHMQSARHGLSERYLEEALKNAAGLHGEERTALFRYLIKQAESISELEIILENRNGMTPLETTRILGAVAGRADRIGDKNRALKWFAEMERALPSIEDEMERAAVSINLAEGMGRLGDKEKAGKILKEIERYAESKPGIARKLCKTMRKLGLETDVCREARAEIREERQKSGISLALFNTYEGGGNSTHLRTIARAAPLCMAYGLDLILVDFPYKDMEKTVEKTIKETNIGKGGKYLRRMLKEERIRLMGHDELLTSGICVATTSHPNAEKTVGMGEVLKIADKRRIHIVMGLGKHGLPSEFLKAAPYHLELTGRNIPLETCTVMGIIAEQVRNSREKP